MSALSKRIKAIEDELIQPVQPITVIWISTCGYGVGDVLGYRWEQIEVTRHESESIDALQVRARQEFIDNGAKGYFAVRAIY